MAKWKVYNMHPDKKTHVEHFKGDKIEIKYGEYVEMDYEDAVQFKSQFFPMKFNADGTHNSDGFKCLKIERPDFMEPEKPKFISQIDGKEFATEAELQAHIKQFQDLVFKDDALEQEIEADKKAKSKPRENRA